MLNLKKLFFISYILQSTYSFGQIVSNKGIYNFQQIWEIKKDHILKGKILIENVKKNIKSPLFKMESSYKIHPISYKNSILIAKTENLLTKRQKIVKFDTLKGNLIPEKKSSPLFLITGIWPQKPVKVGDTWTRESKNVKSFNNFFEDKSSTWTYIFQGIDQSQKIPRAKIGVKINEGLNRQLKGSGTAWICVKDGLISQLDLNLVHTLLKPSLEGVSKHLINVSVHQVK